MKKHIRCGQLYKTDCQAVFEGEDAQEILERVWLHLLETDEHADIRTELVKMSQHQLKKWQEKFMGILHSNTDKERGR